ncbi:MAG: site-specific integrase [Terriglobia bacterium]|jgi:integrase
MDGIFQRLDREGYFLSWVDAQGRRRKRKAKGLTLGEARSERAAEITRVSQARILGFTPPTEDSFEETAKRFLNHQAARLSPKAFERENSIVRAHLSPFFKGRLASIRRGDVQRYITIRSEKVSAASVLRELNCLKHLLRLATEWEIVPVNPAQGVKAPRVGAGRLRYLQPTELVAVLKVCPPWLWPVVALAVCTGMRRSEILGLRWLDVDAVHGRILLPQTKNGEGRIVYLNQNALAAIESLPAGDGTAKLFPGITPEQTSMKFLRACRSVGIQDFRFHDLRHTAASWMRMKGSDIHTVASLLGHKDLRMAARYQHLSPEFLADAVTRLDGVFGVLRPQGVPEQKELPEKSSVTD